MKVSGAGSLHKISQDNMRLREEGGGVKLESKEQQAAQAVDDFQPDALTSRLEEEASPGLDLGDNNIIYLSSSSQPDILASSPFSLSSSSPLSSRRQDVLVGSEMYQVCLHFGTNCGKAEGARGFSTISQIQLTLLLQKS